MTDETRVEFFHDVLCAWCYAFSPRLRRLVDEVPGVNVVHRSFPLALEPEDLAKMFGDRDAAKAEILDHWRAANRNDDGNRINADRMAEREFPYPYSKPALMACKAAEFQGGQDAHWAYFDRVQRAHLTECRNVADPDVLTDCAAAVGLDMDRFGSAFQSDDAEQAVVDDFESARSRNVRGTPTIIIDDEAVLSGAITYPELKNAVEKRNDRAAHSDGR